MNLENQIKAIVIPTGGSAEEDLERAERAIGYNREKRLNTPYIISGLGRDSDRVISQGKNCDCLDFHGNLYDFMLEGTKGIIGWDVNSVDSVGNIIETFPEGTSGTYAIVSYPLHLRKFKKIFERAKREGKISDDVKLVYVPTEQSIRQTIHGILSLVRYFATGK